MTKRAKRLQKLRQNPKDVSFEQLKQVLEDYGFNHIRTTGSHHTFILTLSGQDWRLTIPLNRPIKLPYVRASLKAIDEVIALQEEKDEDENNS